MPGSVLVLISYVLLLIFVAALLVKAFRMWRQPVHLRWELAPVPHEKGRNRYGGSYLEEYEWWTKPREKSLVSELVYMFEEIMFLKSVWENRRPLWWLSFPLHFGLYLLIATAAVCILAAVLELLGVPVSNRAVVRTAIVALAATGYTLGALGAAGLLILRTFNPNMRAFTSPAALFNLVLLCAVFVSGGCALFGSDYVAEVTGFVKALLTADGSVAVSGVLNVHLVVVLLFLAYLPFSQMIHFVAKYFTYHAVRWDDRPLTPGGRLEREVVELLQQPVTWSGPHLSADGKKNWMDIVTEEAEK